MSSVAVVGAGLAGLAAAGHLTRAGIDVVLLEAADHPGGRAATEDLSGGARADSGAQFFTARDDGFAHLVGLWAERGVAREWCRGFTGDGDGHPRYAGVGGMDALGRALAADLNVRYGSAVTALVAGDRRWRVVAGATEPTVDAVVVTPPGSVVVDLLAAGGATPDPAAVAALDRVVWTPTMAVVAALDRPPAIPAPGGVPNSDGPLSFVADNVARGTSTRPSVTLHASPAWSAELASRPDPEILARVLDAGARWLGDAAVIDARVVRWPHAQPTTRHPEPYLMVIDGPAPVVSAGDAFGEARVEGAVLSGWAAGAAVAGRLGTTS